MPLIPQDCYCETQGPVKYTHCRVPRPPCKNVIRITTIMYWFPPWPQRRRSVVKSGGSGSVGPSHHTVSGASNNLFLPSVFDTSLPSFTLWGLQSCRTTVLSERMWHFRGRDMFWPVLYFQGVNGPLQPPWSTPMRGHAATFHRILWKLVEYFLRNPANKQTTKRRQHNLLGGGKKNNRMCYYGGSKFQQRVLHLALSIALLFALCWHFANKYMDGWMEDARRQIDFWQTTSASFLITSYKQRVVR